MSSFAEATLRRIYLALEADAIAKRRHALETHTEWSLAGSDIAAVLTFAAVLATALAFATVLATALAFAAVLAAILAYAAVLAAFFDIFLFGGVRRFLGFLSKPYEIVEAGAQHAATAETRHA